MSTRWEYRRGMSERDREQLDQRAGAEGEARRDGDHEVDW